MKQNIRKNSVTNICSQDPSVIVCNWFCCINVIIYTYRLSFFKVWFSGSLKDMKLFISLVLCESGIYELHYNLYYIYNLILKQNIYSVLFHMKWYINDCIIRGVRAAWHETSSTWPRLGGQARRVSPCVAAVTRCHPLSGCSFSHRAADQYFNAHLLIWNIPVKFWNIFLLVFRIKNETLILQLFYL